MNGFSDEAYDERQALIAATEAEPPGQARIDDLEFALIRSVNWLDHGAPGRARETLLDALKKPAAQEAERAIERSGVNLITALFK